MPDLFSILSKLKLNGFQAEIFSVKVREYAVEWDRGLKSQLSEIEGYGIRVFKDKRVGFAASTRLDEELLNRAIESWKVSKEDEANELPPMDKGESLPLKRFDFDSAIDKVKDAVKSLTEVPDWVVIEKAGASIYSGTIEMASTEGLDKASEFTLSVSSVSGSINRDNAISVDCYRAMRTLDPVTTDEVKDCFLTKVEMTKDVIELDKPPELVTLTPEAIEQLLVPLLRYAVSTEAIYRGTGPLKLNEAYSERLNVTDDPTIPEAPGSRDFDGEGLSSKVNEIIKGGVLVKSINTYYWAKKANVEATHSAVRYYNTLPAAGFSTLRISVKEIGEEEGLVIDSVRGTHTSDFSSGAFSVSVGLAWLPKEGKAIKGLNVSGNLKALLKGIEAEAGEEETLWATKSKSLVIRGLSVLK